MKPDILLVVPAQAGLASLAGFEGLLQDFNVHHAASPGAVDPLIAEVGPRIRAALCSNGMGLSNEQIRAMPNLEFIQTRGMGFENYGLDAVREKGIVLANNRNVNFFSVAEHAMALLLTLVRDLRTAETDIRSGRYVESRARPPRALIYGKHMGILGLGDVGLGIARRAEPFEVTVSYRNRKPRKDVSYPYVDSPLELAKQSDILVIAVPGGPETRGIVDRSVLEALGPKGYLLNVGRGSVVNTGDLVEALHAGTIAGAALDVVDGEPNIPETVLAAPNLVLSPHIGSSSMEARRASVRYAQDNLKAYFAGEPIRNRVM